MITAPSGLAAIYDGWAFHQSELIRVLGPLDATQLTLRPAAEPLHWAIWQLASNMAGGRAYWFHDVLGEGPDAMRDMFRVASTTVPDLALSDAGWEDDEDHPRTAAELVDAFEKTWDVVHRCLERWTADELERPVPTRMARRPTLTRSWVIWHVIEHELQHGTEIALILRHNGLPTLEL